MFCTIRAILGLGLILGLVLLFKVGTAPYPASALNDSDPSSAGTSYNCPSTIEALKIYVYPNLPEILQQSCRPTIRQSQYGTEYYIPELIKNSPVAVSDPSLASLFLVPVRPKHYMNCAVNQSHLAPLGPIVHDFLLQQPYWRRNRGDDHIFIFPSGAGFRIYGPEEEHVEFTRRSIFLATESHVSRKTGILPESNGGQFSTHKDIVVPGYVHDPMLLRANVQKHRSSFDRLLFFFAGKSFFVPVRAQLRDHWTGPKAPRNVLISEPFDSEDIYLSHLAKATFCLCPAGTSPWTKRLFEAIIAGCIPVILSDKLQVPFDRYVDYRKFSIRLPESAVPDLYRLLSSVSLAEIIRYQSELESIWPVFAYFDPRLRRPEQPNRSALDLILCELARRNPAASAVSVSEFWPDHLMRMSTPDIISENLSDSVVKSVSEIRL